MASKPPARSVKISDDERTGWSSDRPRRDGAPPRPANLAVHCSVLAPTDRLRYSPGSLLVVLGASHAERDAFLARLIEDRAVAAVAWEGARPARRAGWPRRRSRSAPRSSCARRSPSGSRAARRSCSPSTASAPTEREPYVRIAAALKRPRHLILLETSRDQVSEEDLAPLNELRRVLDAGELGAEGFQTALRSAAAPPRR